jgi:hypothetical protein
MSCELLLADNYRLSNNPNAYRHAYTMGLSDQARFIGRCFIGWGFIPIRTRYAFVINFT